MLIISKRGFYLSEKILEVCLSPNLGGLELFSYNAYKEFSKKTLCKIVVAPDSKLDNYFESADKLHLKRNKFFPFFSAKKLAKFIDAHDIDIIHFHWMRDSITVILAKLISQKKPIIVQSRHMGMTRFKDDLYHRWIYKNIQKIHAITDQVHQQLCKYIPQDVSPKIKRIYPGVKQKRILDLHDLKEKYGVSNEFIVGIIGRIEEKKGQYKVIDAIEHLKENNIKLFIVGDCMDEAYLRQLKEECRIKKIENKVVFTGFTKNVDSFMQLCDVTVLATQNEAFGLVVVESMANATPVIATDRGGPLEIIEDKKDGLLYNGSSEDLAKKLLLLYNNQPYVKQLSQCALEKVQKKFDFLKQFDKLYDFIIGDR
jgi:glycosyltransferase involved in cell wall biosynthesis